MRDETEVIAELRAAGDAMHAARRESDRVRDIARDLALAAMAGGMSESAASRHVGVERLTLRRWARMQASSA